MAVIAAGIAVLSTPRAPLPVAISVFAVGATSAVLAMLANATGRSYYKSTRDRKRELEERLMLGAFTIAPTPGMGSLRGRLARVTTFQTFMLGALLAADLAGLGTCIARALPPDGPPYVVVAVTGSL